MGSASVDLSFVLPAHNEKGNIEAIATRLTEIAKPLGTFEIIFVDDGSTDGTLAAIRAASKKLNVRYVSFTRNFGHQAALRAGLRYARGRAVVLMDCDFEHPPELVPVLFEEWKRGTKIVLTQRAETAGPQSPLKKFTSRLFYQILDAIGDVHIEPGSADFLLLDRAAVDVINAFKDESVFLRGLVRWVGFPIVKVPYTQGSRQEGESKYTFRRLIDFAITGIIAHSVRPLRISIHLSLIFAILGLLLVGYSIASFLWSNHTVAGWTSLMSAMALLGAGQLLVLGIIGEYIGRILRETRAWPVYLVGETETSFGAPGTLNPLFLDGSHQHPSEETK